MEIAAAHASDPEALERIELLAAIAVTLGMSHNIVTKASNVPRDRIEALVSQHGDELRGLARSEGYERDSSGVVTRTR